MLAGRLFQCDKSPEHVRNEAGLGAITAVGSDPGHFIARGNRFTIGRAALVHAKFTVMGQVNGLKIKCEFK
jgi:hypothetical protein